MKIIHIVDHFQPKLGYQETFLAREHAKLGHDVYVLTSNRYNPYIYSENKELLGSRKMNPGFFVEDSIQVWRLKTLFEVPHGICTLGLENKIRELKPDLIIIHSITSFFAIRTARLKSKIGGFKLIYDEHMTFGSTLSKMRVLYPLFRWGFSPSIQKAADALVAILPETKIFMHKIYGIPLDRIVIIPLGTDDNLFKFDTTSRKEIRSRLSIAQSDIVFIYTGKIIPLRKLHLLIEATARLKTYHDNIKVMLVGNGPQTYLEKLRRDIKTSKLEDTIVWHEAVPNEQLHRFYSAADIAVWPYGASISMREALACGLPIIMGEDSKVTELIDYKNGYTFHEGDATDLAQKMEKLLDPELRMEMGSNSRKLVEDRLNWRTIAKQYIELVL